MTVEQLIKRLQKAPLDANVWLTDGDADPEYALEHVVMNKDNEVLLVIEGALAITHIFTDD